VPHFWNFRFLISDGGAANESCAFWATGREEARARIRHPVQTEIMRGAVAEQKTRRYAHITGWGKCVPDKILTNDDLARLVDTTDEWIVSHTGVRQRRVAASSKETTSTLAIAAAKEALQVAGIAPGQIGLIIVATSTADHIFPATACQVQDALGAENAGAFDLAAACSGFVYALTVGAQMIAGGAQDCVLVIGAETLSRITNWHDRDTCILFGDGAGAVILQGRDDPGGVLSAQLRADGSGGELLIIPAGGSRQPATLDTVATGQHYIHMNGREVFRFATRVMDKAARQVVAGAGLALDDVDLIIPHQANLRIIQSAARALELPLDKFFVNLDRYGNTSAASIPLALCEAVERGRLCAGDHVVLVGFGAGLTWAAALVQWDVPPPPPSAWRRTVDGLRYAVASARSQARRIRRRLEGKLFGNPTLTIDEGASAPPAMSKTTKPPQGPSPARVEIEK
jgi:3-oxoacyl-[acyl-carrier-protein] synthase-3